MVALQFFFVVALSVATALALSWKWGLGIRRSVLFVALVATALAFVIDLIAGNALGALLFVALGWVGTMSLSLAVVAYRFFRDPERHCASASVVVSPADGEIVYVRRVHGGTLPVSTKLGRDHPLTELTRTPLRHEDVIVVGIGMSFLDVHVNRAPIGGRITLQRRFPGQFGSLRRPEMVFQNSRMTTVIEQENLQVAVVQIASRLVRRIATFVRENEDVALGQRIGVIRFGSQVDLVLPALAAVDLNVRVGMHVRAGETIIASLAPDE